MTKNSNTIWDCVMIGAGPTSLAAAIYTAREDISTLLIEKGVIGGLAAITDQVDNYPGFPKGVGGLLLSEQLKEQAQRFGATIKLDEVVGILKEKDFFKLKLAGETTPLSTKAVLVGTGCVWKKLNIKGEQEFYGRGIHNCATCDGAFYRDKDLVIIGGGNSAAQESLFLTKFAKKIDLLVRSDRFRASDVLVQDVLKHPKIRVHFKTKPLEFLGQDKDGRQKLSGVLVLKENQQRELATDGVFVFIGLHPATEFLKDSGVELDENNFVTTDDQFKTNIKGIFCAGDVRSGATMQIASAVGEGASAALSIRHFLDNLK